MTYCISGIFRIEKFWRKWRLKGVLNFQRVLFSLFKDSQWRHIVGLIFRYMFIFGNFRMVANSAKIKLKWKIPDIRYNHDLTCDVTYNHDMHVETSDMDATGNLRQLANGLIYGTERNRHNHVIYMTFDVTYRMTYEYTWYRWHR